MLNSSTNNFNQIKNSFSEVPSISIPAEEGIPLESPGEFLD